LITFTEKTLHNPLNLHYVQNYDQEDRNLYGWICGLTISYMGQEVVNDQLCISEQSFFDEEKKEYAQLWPVNPWQSAIGILGSMGWELISIQDKSDSRTLELNRGIAYFKRPRKEGRKVDEPKFAFPFSPERWYLKPSENEPV
jgi:hypothetical protein